MGEGGDGDTARTPEFLGERLPWLAVWSKALQAASLLKLSCAWMSDHWGTSRTLPRIPS